MAESAESLLQQDKYLEGCPGCIVDRKKQTQRGLPLKQLLTVWIIVIVTASTISSLFPFIYFMIRDFEIAKTEADIGYYAGFVGSSFMVGRVLTSVLWGVIADRYGRKPVIIIGSVAVVVFNTLFGLSLNYWMAITTRFLLGCLNGLLGPMKAYACETVREEYQSYALSAHLVVGPSLGGFLAQPVDKYPAIFKPDSLFGRFPYFLPCLVISIFSGIVMIASFWIPQTLHTHKKRPSQGCSDEALETKSSNTSLFKNWPLMSSITIYCIFSLHDIAYTETFSLWAESPTRLGGLGYTTGDVVTVLAISGLCLLIFQSFVYPVVDKIMGPVLVCRVFGIISIPVLTSHHYIAMLSGMVLFIVLNIASLGMYILSISIDTALCILQNRAVEQHQRGAANGIAITFMSLFKAIGPAGAGIVFSWAQKRQNASFLPGIRLTQFVQPFICLLLLMNAGDHMVFFVLNVIQAIALVLTFKPFLVQPQKS